VCSLTGDRESIHAEPAQKGFCLAISLRGHNKIGATAYANLDKRGTEQQRITQLGRLSSRQG
jgi:hypothetical protein